MSEADEQAKAEGSAGEPPGEPPGGSSGGGGEYELVEEPQRSGAAPALPAERGRELAEAGEEDAAKPQAAGGLKGLYARYVRRPMEPVIEVFSEFIKDDAFTLAAALAYYTALSFAPLIILLLTIASFLGDATAERLKQQLYGLVDEKAANVLTTIIDAARERPDVASTAGWISLATLLFSASGVFAQLQAALNRIWNVKAKPGGGVFAWVRKRLLSFGMVLVLAFILIVSVAATAIIAGMFKEESGRPGWLGMLLQGVNSLVTIGVFTALFGMIFKFLPDVKITWRDVWFGAVVTAILFSVGKYLIGKYLGNSAVGSSYGAAGSLVALLVWVYYSALILFLGAEVTEVWAKRRGSSIEPSEYAVKVGN